LRQRVGLQRSGEDGVVGVVRPSDDERAERPELGLDRLAQEA
jgi:hypothetical protein